MPEFGLNSWTTGEGASALTDVRVAAAAGYRHIELRDWKQFFPSKGHQDVRCEPVPPLGGSLGLFMYRQSLGEPAWDARICSQQDINMAHLMPQRAGPMKTAGFAGRGTV